jgi:hypothetical protein
MSSSWIRQVESRGYSPKTSSSRGAKIPIAKPTFAGTALFESTPS